MRKMQGRQPIVRVVACGVCVLAALVVGVVFMRDAATYRMPSGSGGHRTEFQVGLILVMVASAPILLVVGGWLRTRLRTPRR